MCLSHLVHNFCLPHPQSLFRAIIATVLEGSVFTLLLQALSSIIFTCQAFNEPNTHFDLLLSKISVSYPDYLNCHLGSSRISSQIQLLQLIFSLSPCFYFPLAILDGFVSLFVNAEQPVPSKSGYPMRLLLSFPCSEKSMRLGW